jgi:hypothetical protein
LIGSITLVVVSVICYFLTSYFDRINKKKHDIAVAAKKAADAKLARGGDLREENSAISGSDDLGAPLIRG